MPVIYKEDGTFDCEMLLKAADNFMDRGELLAVVYAPELRDSQGDIASATVIKDMMYDAAKRGESIDIRHDGKPLSKDQVYVAERFIVQKDDARFKDFKDYEGKLVDVTDAWATVLKIEDQALRQKYKDGDWNGISMGGHADFALDKEDSLADRVVSFLIKKLGLSNKDEDTDMDAAEYETLMVKNNKVLAEAIGKSVGEAISKAAEPDDGKDKDADKDKDQDKNKAPEFKGDASKAEDVQKHQDVLTAWGLQKDVDWSSAESVKTYNEKLAAMKKAADGKADEGKSDEVKKLEAEKAEITKKLETELGKSQQTDGDAPGTKGQTQLSEGLSKEDLTLFAAGQKMAKAQNEATGNK